MHAVLQMLQFSHVLGLQMWDSSQTKLQLNSIKRTLETLCVLSGIGARAPGLMKSAEASDRIIAIDGCPVNCASKTLELAGFKVDSHIIISEFGIKKTKDKELKDDEVLRSS